MNETLPLLHLRCNDCGVSIVVGFASPEGRDLYIEQSEGLHLCPACAAAAREKFPELH